MGLPTVYTVIVDNSIETDELTNWLGDNYGYDNFDNFERDSDDENQDVVEFEGPHDLIERIEMNSDELPEWLHSLADEDGEHVIEA